MTRAMTSTWLRCKPSTTLIWVAIPVSPALSKQAQIDQLVVDLVKKQHQKAYALLREHRQKLDEIVQYLHEKETITGEEFMELLHA